jgi:glyoxylase-like metal-dependent hydrolase (beta-lactamase superfamily II)
VRLLPVPTPFAVGPMNAYLVERDELLLVDTGPNLATSYAGLSELVGEAGRRLEDVSTIMLTHQHFDHIGLAASIVARSNARVVCHGSTRAAIEDFESAQDVEDDFAAALMLQHGTPQVLVAAIRAAANVIKAFGASVAIDETLIDGQSFGALEIAHVPGHSPSDTLFIDRETRIAFGGDHLLAHISSNALVSLGSDRQRRRPLLEYRESLARTRTLDLAVVLPGHGVPILDHRTLIDRRLREHDERAARLLELLGAGPRTTYDLARELFRGRAQSQAFLTLSEVLGHLDLLLSRGQIAENATESPTLFERV